MAHFSTDDRFAIIALTTPLGLAPGENSLIEPLSIRKWSRLARWLRREDIGPAELQERSSGAIAALSAIDAALPLQVANLLSRCDRIERAVRELENRGIWIATVGERGYPKRWSRTFETATPPLVYGDGTRNHVDHCAIGIVGSRDISERMASIANDLGAGMVLGDYAVVSGGARGTDRVGMNGALEVGGTVIGILPDHLQRERLRRSNREAIDAGHLTMISVVHPDTPFEVGNAMYRNRLIYALSDLTIVVSTSEGRGGTWAGAVGNMRHRWAPMAVWTGAGAPEANYRLVDQGIMALTTVPQSSSDVRALVRNASSAFDANDPRLARPENRQLGLFEP